MDLFCYTKRKLQTSNSLTGTSYATLNLRQQGNVPNPFAEQTSISYFIPEDVTTAQIMFFDISGRVIKTVDVQKGKGIITVFASNLSSGTYNYSLLVDGKPVETKKMVKMK
jgi:hypothetical protein